MANTSVGLSSVWKFMHVAVSGVVLLFCLSQVVFDQELLNLQIFQRKRQCRPADLFGSSVSNKKAKL